MSPLYMTRFHYVLSPSSLHDVLVDEAVAEDVFVEELIGEEHQQRGHRLEQDAVGDVAANTKIHIQFIHTKYLAFLQVLVQETTLRWTGDSKLSTRCGRE